MIEGKKQSGYGDLIERLRREPENARLSKEEYEDLDAFLKQPQNHPSLSELASGEVDAFAKLKRIRDYNRKLRIQSEKYPKIRNIIIAIFLAAIFICLFEMGIHLALVPCGEWIRNHSHTIGLQLSFDFIILLVSMSIFVPPWRYYCWCIGIVPSILIILQII